MRKSAIIAMIVGTAAVAAAGQKVEIAAPPALPSPLTVELAGVYDFGMNQFMKSGYIGKKNHVNQFGGDITVSYALDGNQSVNFRMGYKYGSDKFALVGRDYITTLVSPHLRAEESLHTVTLLPGYRYTWTVDEQWKVFAGANAGLACNIANVGLVDTFDARSFGKVSGRKSAWNFAYSLEAGASYKVSATVDIFAAASWSGNLARPSVRIASETIGKLKAQQYIGVRVGAAIKF